MGAVAAFDPSAAGLPKVSRAPAPDADARSFLRIFNMMGPGNMDAVPLALMRQRWRYLALALGRRDFYGSVRDVVIAGPEQSIRLRIYTPRGGAENRPAFVWFHGGAFLIGEADTADSICRNIVNAAGCVVIAVEYRLAPEHDLFAGRADCLAAMNWIFEEGRAHGIDPDRIAVGGDSAGGNLAAVIAQECRRNGRALRLQVLVYPATNLGDEFPSNTENAHGYLLTKDSIDWITRTIGEGFDYRDPRLSPAYASDLGGLAPALVVTAGFDPIRDDGLCYANLLRRAGVPVELLHYAGQFHGFINFDSVISAARDALDRIASALGQALSGHPDAAPNRTVEIVDTATAGEGGLAAFREWMTAGFMTGEWLEYHRNRMFKAMLPGFSQPLSSSGLFNIAASMRGMITASTLKASETYAQPLGGARDVKERRRASPKRQKAGASPPAA